MEAMTERPYHDREWLEERAEEGMTQAQMAEEAGVTQVAIHYWMERHGVEPPPRFKYDPEEMAEMYRSGMTLADIGDELGVAKSSVSEYFKRHFDAPDLTRGENDGWEP